MTPECKEKFDQWMNEKCDQLILDHEEVKKDLQLGMDPLEYFGAQSS